MVSYCTHRAASWHQTFAVPLINPSKLTATDPGPLARGVTFLSQSTVTSRHDAAERPWCGSFFTEARLRSRRDVALGRPLACVEFRIFPAAWYGPSLPACPPSGFWEGPDRQVRVWRIAAEGLSVAVDDTSHGRAASSRTREMTCWCSSLQAGKELCKRRQPNPREKGGRSRASKRGVEFHRSEAGFVVRTSRRGRQLVVTASRNGQDDLIGILTPSVRLQHGNNGDRRAELYINKHMRGRTGRRVISKMGLKEKGLALGGAVFLDPRFGDRVAG